MQAAGRRAAVAQVDGGRWLSLEGPVRLVTDPEGVRAGVDGYAARYRPPKDRDDRVVILRLIQSHTDGRTASAEALDKEPDALALVFGPVEPAEGGIRTFRNADEIEIAHIYLVCSHGPRDPRSF